MVESKTKIADYAAIVAERVKTTQEVSGKQPGDPARGAAAIIQVVDSVEPPLRLLLGSDAYQLALSRLDTLRSQFEACKDLSLSTNFSQE